MTSGCLMMGTLLLGWDTDSLMKYNICYFIKLIKLSNFLHVNFDFILFLSRMNSTLLRFLKLRVYISTWSYLLPLLFKFQWRIIELRNKSKCDFNIVTNSKIEKIACKFHVILIGFCFNSLEWLFYTTAVAQKSQIIMLDLVSPAEKLIGIGLLLIHDPTHVWWNNISFYT